MRQAPSAGGVSRSLNFHAFESGWRCGGGGVFLLGNRRSAGGSRSDSERASTRVLSCEHLAHEFPVGGVFEIGPGVCAVEADDDGVADGAQDGEKLDGDVTKVDVQDFCAVALEGVEEVAHLGVVHRPGNSA